MVVGDRDRRSNRRVAAVRHFIAVVDGVANRRIRTARGNRLDQRQGRRLRRRRRRLRLIGRHRSGLGRRLVRHRTGIEVALNDVVAARARDERARRQSAAWQRRTGHARDMVVGDRDRRSNRRVAAIRHLVAVVDGVANRRIRTARGNRLDQRQSRRLRRRRRRRGLIRGH